MPNYKNCQTYKVLPKWRNLVKSGHTVLDVPEDFNARCQKHFHNKSVDLLVHRLSIPNEFFPSLFWHFLSKGGEQQQQQQQRRQQQRRLQEMVRASIIHC